MSPFKPERERAEPFITEGQSSHNSSEAQTTTKFPEIFTNEHFRYPDKKYEKKLACADGLFAWGLCMAGNKPPKNFGEGMIKIETILKNELDDTGATSEGLKNAAEKILSQT